MDRLTAMEVLVRTVETGSFSVAARQLRVGQPAVSKTVAQLEERLGVSCSSGFRAGSPRPKQARFLRARQALDLGGRRGGARDAGAVLRAGCASARASRSADSTSFRSCRYSSQRAFRAHGRSDPRRPAMST